MTAKAWTIRALSIVLAIAGPYVQASSDTAPPSLSPDGQTVVFVRETPGITVDAALGTTEAKEIWTARPDGSGARMRLRGRTGKTPEDTLADLSDPQFSPNGDQVYFLSTAWVTSGAVHALDLATGVERYVCPGNSLEVIRRGRYAGYLMVAQHRYLLGGGSYDWLWLITPEGKDVGPISMGDDEAIRSFRQSYVD